MAKISDMLRQARQAQPVQHDIEEGQEFANLLKKRFRNVKYKNGKGTADLGMIQVAWEQSQNEDAIWLSLQQRGRVKAFDPEDAVKALQAINKALASLG